MKSRPLRFLLLCLTLLLPVSAHAVDCKPGETRGTLSTDRKVRTYTLDGTSASFNQRWADLVAEGTWSAPEARSATAIVVSCTPAATTPPPPAPVDCVLSAFTEWAPTSDWNACTNGTQSRTESRTRSILVQPANGGLSCGPLTETRIVSQTCTATPPPPTTSLLFSNGWQNRTDLGAGSIDTLLDRTATTTRANAFDDFGPGFEANQPYNRIAEIVNTTGANGQPTRALQVNFEPDGTQNGPDFRIGNTFGNRQEVWGRALVKYSDDDPATTDVNERWVWAGADHKIAILGDGATFSQDVYFNVRGAGDGGNGFIAVHVLPIDGLYEVPDSTMLIGQWNLLEWHIKCGAGGAVEVKLRGQMLTLVDRTGRNPNPRNINPCRGGIGYVKLDTTYNLYRYPSSLGKRMKTWFDNVAISTSGWIGN